MDPVDLQKLSDFDFENLCKDLFTRLLGFNLEIFTPGPDDGVDLRHLGLGRKVIIQCKHWMRSGRAKFLRHMLDSELPKVRRLNPTRYIIATSVGITPQAKEKLYEEFQPYIRSMEDIYGVDEIASALGDHPDIIRKNIRLWLNDATILEAAITRNIAWRSLHLADGMKETLRTYVPSRNLRQAMHAIDKDHVCILAGPPGVGKSTLAQVICAHYASQSFELIEVSENIEDVYRVWDDNSRQIFIYDDFLGQSSLNEKLHKNEDSRLLSIMNRVRRDPKKRLICTTRGYILNQARHRYERLDSANLNAITFTVNLEGLTRKEKAEILHNHVFWSEWPQHAKEDFSYPESYRPILRHRNFNPRAITTALSVPFDPSRGTPTSQILASLDDPTSLWRHIFDHQLSDSDRSLLALLFSFGSKSSIEVLQRAFVEQGAGRGAQFRTSLQILDGTFIHIFSDREKAWVEFSNPSVNDFMLAKLAIDDDLVLDILTDTHSFDQISNLWDAQTGPCDAEAPAKIDLSRCAVELEKAALRTLSRPETTEHDLVDRLTICLSIAKKFDTPELEQYAVEKLSIQGVVYRAKYLDDIVHIIRLTRESKNKRILSLHPQLTLEGLSALFNRDRRECGLFRAAIYALLLKEFVEEGIKERILAEADLRVDDLLEEAIYGPGEPEHESLQYALQYIRHYEDFEQRWPLAADVIDGFGFEVDEVESDDDNDEVASMAPELVDGVIYQIMSALRINGGSSTERSAG